MLLRVLTLGAEKQYFMLVNIAFFNPKIVIYIKLRILFFEISSLPAVKVPGTLEYLKNGIATLLRYVISKQAYLTIVFML